MLEDDDSSWGEKVITPKKNENIFKAPLCCPIVLKC
jgi:hypothetical protein